MTMILFITMKMNVILFFSVFLFLIFTNICPAVADTDCSQCPRHEKPMDCAELLQNGVNSSGLYTIYPRTRLDTCQIVYAYCDMETDGGGWTVIQRRGQYGNPEDYFDKTWDEYRDGFGNMNEAFWLGNDKIYAMTNQGQYALRVDLHQDDGYCAFARYENFWVENEDAKYKLHISDCTGPAGDAISTHNGYLFYTIDQPNKPSSGIPTRSGGWWANGSPTSSLNGLNLYKTDRVNSMDGITWSTFGGFQNSLKATEMKIRPKNFPS